MQSKWVAILAFVLSATIYSCHKKVEEVVTCITPDRELIQGSWKEDWDKEPSLQPPPEWEKLEFRNDSFFIRIRVRTDILTDHDCYERSWLEYAKGVYHIDSMKIHFNGILTDSNYVIKTGGCHSVGNYQSVVGISLCGDTMTFKFLFTSTSIPEDDLKVKMYKF
jgi:hypothetical protein